MNTFKKTMLATAALSTMAMGVAPVAVAEIAASATISSSYLWRGYDLGSGTPALSADLVYSEGGFYGGLWLSSGDTASGTEYDFFAGYGGSVGEFSYDISYATYIYPTKFDEVTDAETGETSMVPMGPNKSGELAEYIYSIGYGPVSLTVYEDVDSDYTYTTVGYDISDFSLMYGAHKDGQENFDVTYSYNESLSFIYSVPFGVDGDVEAEPTFVASYSLPF
jgi:uncharacterized protein (TIGR02001 family)